MKEIFESTGEVRNGTGRLRAVFIRDSDANFRENGKSFREGGKSFRESGKSFREGGKPSREVGDPVDGEEKAAFICAVCGEAVFRGESCLAVRIPAGEVCRICGTCAGEPLSLSEHLDRLGMRYFSGPAEDEEAWESLGR